MFGVLGEDKSDAETVKVLIKRLAKNESLSVKTKGYSGCGELKRKGATQLGLFAEIGCTKFVVCYDADGADPVERRAEIEHKVTKPSGLDGCCVVVPVQEIEAWILADIQAATKIFTGWKPKPIGNPETIPEPKEHLEKLSTEGVARPRYSHATHNPQVAKYLDLDRVRSLCKSFVPLHDFVSHA